MFNTNKKSILAHFDAAMKAAKTNDKESMDINLKWAKEKYQTLTRLTIDAYEYGRADLKSAPAYQIWSGNRELIERGAGSLGLDTAHRTHALALDTYNHITSTFKNLKVELRQYYSTDYQKFYTKKMGYQILKLRP